MGQEGASQSQKEANSAPERASPTKLQTGFQFLTKDFLRFWMVDIHREDPSQRSATQKIHTWDGRTQNPSGWDWGGDKTHCTWRECTHQAPGHLSCSDPGTAQNAGPTDSAPLWSTWEPDPSGLDLGSTHNSGPTPCRATWSLRSVGWESTQPVSRGKPSVAETLRVLPTHTPVIFVCTVPPSPQHSWRSEPKKETTSAPLCQGRN